MFEKNWLFLWLLVSESQCMRAPTASPINVYNEIIWRSQLCWNCHQLNDATVCIILYHRPSRRVGTRVDLLLEGSIPRTYQVKKKKKKKTVCIILWICFTNLLIDHFSLSALIMPKLHTDINCLQQQLL